MPNVVNTVVGIVLPKEPSPIAIVAVTWNHRMRKFEVTVRECLSVDDGEREIKSAIQANMQYIPALLNVVRVELSCDVLTMSFLRVLFSLPFLFTHLLHITQGGEAALARRVRTLECLVRLPGASLRAYGFTHRARQVSSNGCLLVVDNEPNGIAFYKFSRAMSSFVTDGVNVERSENLYKGGTNLCFVPVCVSSNSADSN